MRSGSKANFLVAVGSVSPDFFLNDGQRIYSIRQSEDREALFWIAHSQLAKAIRKSFHSSSATKVSPGVRAPKLLCL
ncbi:MAG: hypothetical protein DME74_04650 [Verrucomicrobia bacterium]|nr:MAG: hypothetical protein DME74_04650 [Verrucomicrobiota bacterium]